MNIDRLNQNLASGAYSRRAGNAGDAASAREAGSTEGVSESAGASASRTDGVQLSEQGRSLARVRQAVQSAPDVREQLVSELRQKVQDGTYQIDDQAIAQRLTQQD